MAAAPDEEYERKCLDFASAILSDDSSFLGHFLPFAGKIIEAASVYSLSQLLIKLTAPGIPDIYQGAELWDLNLVDPDNRRSIDYESRQKILAELDVGGGQAGDYTVACWEPGQVSPNHCHPWHYPAKQ